MRTIMLGIFMLLLALVPLATLSQAGEPSVVFGEAPALIPSAVDIEAADEWRRENIIWARGLLPRAEIDFVSLHFDQVFTHREDVESYTRGWTWFADKGPEFGRSGTLTNVLGKVDWIRFKVTRGLDLKCFGWLQYFGEATGWDNDRGVPPNYVGGYYCNNQAPTDGFIIAALQSIGIEGYKTP